MPSRYLYKADKPVGKVHVRCMPLQCEKCIHCTASYICLTRHPPCTSIPWSKTHVFGIKRLFRYCAIAAQSLKTTLWSDLAMKFCLSKTKHSGWIFVILKYISSDLWQVISPFSDHNWLLFFYFPMFLPFCLLLFITCDLDFWLRLCFLSWEWFSCGTESPVVCL